MTETQSEKVKGNGELHGPLLPLIARATRTVGREEDFGHRSVVGPVHIYSEQGLLGSFQNLNYFDGNASKLRLLYF